MLFLFDIDGTLLRRMPPAHRQAVCDAIAAVYGAHLTPNALMRPEDLGQTAGMTDSAIGWRALRALGVPDEAIAAGMPAFFAAAAAAYTRHVPADLRPYHTPHAEETLAWLAARGEALALVTGNVEAIAWTKLRAAHLDHYFACGAFGDEAIERQRLPPLALTRARATFRRDFAPEQVFVVGDTPADVACGLACGMRSVAVATGPVHAVAELLAAGAHHACADLRGLRALDLA
jgi:phosphoglycolate phosphatase-like HAD superfamily hydrolase